MMPDDQQHPGRYHGTRAMEHETTTGWTATTSVPGPYPAALVGASR